MPFSQEELAEIVHEIRSDDNYFANSESICNKCAFFQTDDNRFDDVAVDNLTRRELHFSILGRVVRRSSFLLPEGAFRPSRVFPTKQDELSSLLNSCIRVSLAPPRDVLDPRTVKDDWKSYQTTLARLIKVSMEQAQEGAIYWSPYRKDKNMFILRHPLISAKENPSERARDNYARTVTTSGGVNFMSSQTGEINHDPVEDDNGARLSDQREDVEKHVDELARIINWPANEDWHKVADRFDRTHYINPFAAFDDEYEIIAPKSYESKLLGAVVHARFTLNRFEIRGDHIFVCDITELQVLRPPLGGAADLKKKTLTDLIMDKKRKKRRLD